MSGRWMNIEEMRRVQIWLYNKNEVDFDKYFAAIEEYLQRSEKEIVFNQLIHILFTNVHACRIQDDNLVRFFCNILEIGDIPLEKKTKILRRMTFDVFRHSIIKITAFLRYTKNRTRFRSHDVHNTVENFLQCLFDEVERQFHGNLLQSFYPILDALTNDDIHHLGALMAQNLLDSESVIAYFGEEEANQFSCIDVSCILQARKCLKYLNLQCRSHEITERLLVWGNMKEFVTLDRNSFNDVFRESICSYQHEIFDWCMNIRKSNDILPLLLVSAYQCSNYYAFSSIFTKVNQKIDAKSLVASDQGLLSIPFIEFLLSWQPTLANSKYKGVPLIYSGSKIHHFYPYLIVFDACHLDRSLNDQQGATLLHNAVFSGSIEAVQYVLLMNGVNVNAQTKVGETPLHWACRGEKEEIALILLEIPGIDCSIISDVFFMPLETF